jgi:cell division protein FtsL
MLETTSLADLIKLLGAIAAFAILASSVYFFFRGNFSKETIDALRNDVNDEQKRNAALRVDISDLTNRVGLIESERDRYREQAERTRDELHVLRGIVSKQADFSVIQQRTADVLEKIDEHSEEARKAWTEVMKSLVRLEEKR